jgi:putative glutamine amidotransferase
MRPIILVTTDRRDGAPPNPGPRIRPKRSEAWISEVYVDAVRRAGGQALLVPPGPADVQRLLSVADGIVLTGGAFDIHPSHYGEVAVARLDRVEEARTTLELALASACLEQGVPILGICGGMQAMAVAAGGSLYQHVPDVFPDEVDHEQPTDPATPWHDVHVEPPASAWLGAIVQANSTHHQAVAKAGRGLTLCGWSSGGVPEVLAGTLGAFALGVQWHPELLGDLAAYRALVAAAQRRSASPA